MKKVSKERNMTENWKGIISNVEDNTHRRFFHSRKTVIVGTNEYCTCTISLSNPCVFCGKRIKAIK